MLTKKSFLTVLSLLLIINLGLAQNAPINFETGGFGADWTWTTFENDTNPPVLIIPNPDPTGVNTSATVASFTALQSGQPWAGCESQHGADIGSFSFDVSNSTVKIMVWKPVISDVGIKFAEANGDAQPEVKVANTVTNQWEELTFDLSGSIGVGATGIVDQIIVFPDYDLNGRASDNVVYFDNITFSGQSLPNEPTIAAPTPSLDAGGVISLFSNAYTDVTVDTWSADWDVANVSDVQIAADDVKLYTGLNYAGIEFTSEPIDATDMTHFHMDIWTPDATDDLSAFKVKLVDFGGDGAWSGGDDTEHELTFMAPVLASETWVSLDMLLDDFTNMTAREHLAQLVISGDPNTVYVDNIYFASSATGLEDGQLLPRGHALLSNYPNPFNPSTTIRYQLTAETTVHLSVYDVRGQLVRTLVNDQQAAGYYHLQWDGRNHAGQPVGTGVFLARLEVGNFCETIKMVYMK